MLYDIQNKISQIFKQSPTMLDIIIGVILFILALTEYLKRLAPSIYTGDSADATIASYVLGIPHPPGFPVYTWLGHIFTFIPIGDIAFRVNLMSAFFGALAIPTIYIIIRSLAPRSEGGFIDYASRYGAIIGSMSFAFSFYYWQQAEIAEVSTLNLFFVAFMILLALIWSEWRDSRLLYLLSLLFSLSLGISPANILFIPSFLVFLFLIDRKSLLNKRTILHMVVLFSMIGAFQFLYLYLRAWQGPAYAYADIRNLDNFLNFITGREYSSIPFSLPLSLGLGIYANFLVKNFSLVGISIGIIGIIISFSKDMLKSAFLASLFLINTLFFVRYNSFDIYDKLIPSFMIFSIFIGIGIYKILNLIDVHSKSVSICGSGKKGYFFKTFLIALVIVTAAYVPTSSYASYYKEVDRSTSIDLSYFLAQSLSGVPTNSTIIDVWHTCVPLKYFQIVYDMNPTVEILGVDPLDWSNRVHERINRRDIFLLRKDIADETLLDHYNVIPYLSMPSVGVLYTINQINSSFSVSNPAIQHLVNKLLGGKIKFLGYDLNQTERKDSFSITYYWMSMENVSKDYICALDLIDREGNVALEYIHIPVYGVYPTSRWSKDQMFVEKFNIYLPTAVKSGTYQMFMIGTWNNDDSAGYDEILLGNIEVNRVDPKYILVNYGGNN